MQWLTSRYVIDLSRPIVMGIVNVTPDSFSDGGALRMAGAAQALCDRLVAEGAGILDIGGESTRPGAQAPTVAEELARVLPVVQHAVRLGVPVSVDTSQTEVMRAALDAGADIINDVRSFTRPGALQVLAAHASAGACVMHMQGEPDTMVALSQYDDVVVHVRDFLQQQLQRLVQAGVAAQRVVLDPGIGFAKTAAHNWALLQRQAELLTLGRPLLLGWSRKGSLGQLTGRPVDQRQSASVAAALAAVQRGASIVRVHDVAATVDALKVWHAAGLPCT